MAASRPSRKRVAAELAEYRDKRAFERTAEPRGADRVPAGRTRSFVIQKHAARRLHFDLRLEVGGVLRSWAVPKGPSLDPAERRLAVEVEDHPVEYGTFEGTIAPGEYGGGTVMLWDRGHFTVDGLDAGEDPDAAMLRLLDAGKVSITLHGERLRGSFGLVRTRGAEGEKPRWLLLKHADDGAEPGHDPVAEWTESVASGRSMEEIAAGTKRQPSRKRRPPPRPAAAPSSFSPMLATAGAGMPEGEGWTFEPKWDGVRVVAFAAPDGAALLTRNGNDKQAQFPEVVAALTALASARGRPCILDGELVATEGGRIARFEPLQARLHLTDAAAVRRLAQTEPAVLVAFDLLLDGEEVLVGEPWTRRRQALEAVLAGEGDATVRLGESSADAAEMMRRARAEGWEGLIAKRTSAPYTPGTRSDAWRKVKLEQRQEFVVGGWTEPRGSRPHFGALLLGYYDPEGRLVYAGTAGTGFSQDDLRALHRRLTRLERKTPPFRDPPDLRGTAHWTTPRLVVEVRFNEWTRGGVLRHPVFLGVRDDKEAREVVREGGATGGAADAVTVHSPDPPGAAIGPAVVERLTALEEGPGEGDLPVGAHTLAVTNLRKRVFPRARISKGELLRFYAAMAPHILPHMADRPLVLKRFPEGIRGASFFQQSPADEVPDGVRVETLELREGEPQRRFVGGDLFTLLHTVQLGAISYDPWHSRVDHLDAADYTILDLDPGPGASFRTVVQVARAVAEELDRAGLRGALKTSGSTGLHIYLPLPPATPLEAARLVAEIVATRVASRHPKIATVERMTRRRARGTVYVDYLQNILGKSVAGVYAVRARPAATVSTPLRWDELTDDLEPGAFTIRSVTDRIREHGDPWAEAMRRGNSLDALLPGS